MKWLALPLLSLVAASASAAEPAAGSLGAAVEAYYAEARTAGLPTAYRRALADDGIVMFLQARGRAELEPAIAQRVAPSAKFFATPRVIQESAAHDLGYAWGDYRLELIRKSTGLPATLHGRYVQIWRRDADGIWKLFLENWAPQGEVASGNSPALAPAPAARLTGTLREAEHHFTAHAARDGIRPAFLAHVADDATIMFLNARGRAEIERAMSAIPADAHIFAEPAIVTEAASGDLGFAWGPYRFEATVNDKPFAATGKFITVWRKDADGAWRIVLDHGTQDPDPAPAPAEAKKS
jgi:ketosteroid isomerase-like protein